jgi:hypothetical protein
MAVEATKRRARRRRIQLDLLDRVYERVVEIRELLALDSTRSVFREAFQLLDWYTRERLNGWSVQLVRDGHVKEVAFAWDPVQNVDRSDGAASTAAQTNQTVLADGFARVLKLVPRVTTPAFHELLKGPGSRYEPAIEPTAEYRGEAECFEALTKRVEELKTGDQLLAICTKKNWLSLEVRRYFEANLRALQRKVQIDRVFYDVQPTTLQEAQKQAEAGFGVSVLRRQAVNTLSRIKHIHPEVGVAVFNDSSVFLHWGVGSDAYGCVYDSPQLAYEAADAFRVLRGLADPLRPSAEAQRESVQAG